MNAPTFTLRRPRLTPKPHAFDRWARRAVCRRLQALTDGELVLCDAEGTLRYGRRSKRCDLGATLVVHDPRFWSEVAFGGSIGAGEAYMLGYWSTDDLTAVVRILLQNRAVLDGVDGSWTRLTAPLQRGLHWLNRNTRAGSRRNIAAHYDLGNEFFALFLDPSLMYSSALYEREDMTLEAAQTARLERICRKLALQSGDRLLEIGTGWGGMAIYAARRYGCRVTTTTISRQQFAAARERVQRAGVADRVSVLLEDYRDLRGVYDKLVSLEMIEAVGHAYYDTYFSTCSRLLSRDGLMLLQAITIADQRYEAARRSVDFIQRHIFPGSCIPSISALMAAVARASDLRLLHLEDIGPHYARTLADWRNNFLGKLDAVRALGYSETFIRMWEFYLCYCEGGFAERAIGDAQLLLAMPDNRRAPIAPPLPQR